MKFTLSDTITQKIPDASIGTLLIRNIDNTKSTDATYQVLWSQIEETAKKYRETDPNQIPNIEKWQKALNNVYLDPSKNTPSHEALISRIIQRQNPPNINGLVNIYNYISVKYEIPVGGHDINKTEGDIEVGPNTKNFTFSPINSDKKEAIPQKEIVYKDEEEILTRGWVHRQSSKSMIDESTQNVFIPIDNIGNLSSEELKKIALDIYSLVNTYLGSKNTTAKFGIVNKDENTVEFDELEDLSEPEKFEFKTHTISRNPQIIKQLTTRAVETIYPSKEKFKEMLLSGRRLNVYQGFDPTADTLHIGHTAGMRKLRYFQKLGHKVIFLVGDFTGRIGDPTDKGSARQKLTKQQVEENMKLYKDQASKILDFEDPDNPVEVLYNSHWLSKLDFADIVELTSEFTVQQMIKRDMFQDRLNQEKPIFIHEFMYPLMQAYDSFHMNIDVEVGGNDQMFNMLCGRELELKRLNKEKVILPNKLLVDPTGRKMGKSEGNMVMLSDSAKDMYGKVMTFTDGMIVPGFEILTDIPLSEIEEMQQAMQQDKTNPMKFKKKLAKWITAEHKGEDAAQKAEDYFEEVYQQKSNQEADIEVIQIDDSEVGIIELIREHAEFTDSNSKAKRLVKQNAVSVNDKKITDKNATIEIPEEGVILRAGKQIIKITPK